eukprot:12577270-Prorocentrum_lima.AAC.1
MTGQTKNRSDIVRICPLSRLVKELGTQLIWGSGKTTHARQSWERDPADKCTIGSHSWIWMAL